MSSGLRQDRQGGSPNRPGTPYQPLSEWTMDVWSKCQAHMRFSPFAFASNELEEAFMDYFKDKLRSTTTLSCCISLVVTGLKLWRSYRLWGTPGTESLQAGLLAAVLFWSTLPLVISHSPTFFMDNYNTIMFVSRGFKVAVGMWLQRFMMMAEVRKSAPGLIHDAFITSLAEVLLVMPLADPMFCVPGLASHLVFLALAVSQSGATCLATFSPESPLAGLARRMPFAPSLSSLSGFPGRCAASAEQCQVAEGLGCSSLLAQIQLNACAVGLVLSLVFEFGWRRAFLRANLPLLGRNAAQKVKVWPWGDIRGFAICISVFTAFIQGYLLLAEVLVWG